VNTPGRASAALGAGSAFLALWVAACAGTHPAPKFASDPKADFSAMKTYAWDDGDGFQLPHGDSIVDGHYIDERVRAAVDRELAGKGIHKAPAGGAAMLVSYRTGDTGVADEVKDPNMAWLTGYEITDYEKSRTIAIDIRSPAHKLVWRGSIARLEGQNPEAVGRSLDHDVAVLMEHFPPK